MKQIKSGRNRQYENYGYMIVCVVIVSLTIMYIVNLAKVFSCDFKSPYDCEIIHIFGGVIPQSSFITVWYGTDGEQN